MKISASNYFLVRFSWTSSYQTPELTFVILIKQEFKKLPKQQQQNQPNKQPPQQQNQTKF